MAGSDFVTQFYDELAPYYPLLYRDWEDSVRTQADALDRLFRHTWGSETVRVLDAACGIGTQALGLAELGYDVTASDLSPGAVERARREAERRCLPIDLSVADLRSLAEHHHRSYAFDVVIACDNAIPHLLNDAEIRAAFEQLYSCTRPGGGCVISVRDYAAVERSGTRIVPHGVHTVDGARYTLLQVWDFEGPTYDLDLYVIEDRRGGECRTRVLRSRYNAVPIDRLLDLMRKAGFREVQRLDNVLFQPVLVGTRPHRNHPGVGERPPGPRPSGPPQENR